MKTEKSVVDAPPLRRTSEVVALCPAAGCVHASYAVRPLDEPQPLAVAESVPSGPTCKQRVLAPPADERMRFVVDAVDVFIVRIQASGYRLLRDDTGA